MSELLLELTNCFSRSMLTEKEEVECLAYKKALLVLACKISCFLYSSEICCLQFVAYFDQQMGALPSLVKRCFFA